MRGISSLHLHQELQLAAIREVLLPSSILPDLLLTIVTTTSSDSVLSLKLLQACFDSSHTIRCVGQKISGGGVNSTAGRHYIGGIR